MLPSNPNSMSNAPAAASWAETVHALSNVMTAVLMNSQVLDWKLPPYSRLKRLVREIERNAQRGGELLKQLQRQLGPVASPDVSGADEFCGPAPGSKRGADPKCGEGEVQEPGGFTARQANLPPVAGATPAPGSFVSREG